MVVFFIIKLLLIFSLIKQTKNQCEKDHPIYFNGVCQSIFCTESQFENGECIIANSNAKEQWLNNIIFIEEEFSTIDLIEMPNKDIILANSYYDYDIYMTTFFFYYLNSNGDIHLIKTFDSVEFYTDYYELNAGFKIGNQYYPLACDMYDCFIFDLDNNISYQKDYNELMQIDVTDNYGMLTYTNYFTVINIDNQNKILFTYFNQKIYLSRINIKTNDFSDSSFEKLHKSNEEIEELEGLAELTIFKCFITEKKFIECIYIRDNQYLVAVYDESLNYLNNIFLQTVDYTNPTHTSIHAICLKKEIGIFSYYINNIDSPLKIQINELYNHNGRYQFNNLIPEINVSFGDIDYLRTNDANLKREDMTKITDNIFSYVILYSFYEDYIDYVILIIIFDLFNNDRNLFIRYYTINSVLYNIRINSQIKSFNFNSFLGLTFYGGKASGSINNAFYVILGNSKKNIDKITLDIYKLNQGFILDLKDHYSSIDNNLFGYKLNIKISYISNGLEGVKFYSINKNKEIKMNELINKEDSIIFDFFDVNVQIGKEYIVEITSTVLGPEYNKFIELCDKYENYGEDYRNYYESRIVEEKIFTIEIKFSCHESSTSCDYPNLTTKTIQNDDNNIIYLSNFVYKGEEKIY